MKQKTALILLFLLLAFFFGGIKKTVAASWWDFQSVDTMKISRDLAREKRNSESFEAFIDKQVSEISGVGATHLAIATPYDEEFIPFLKKWVAAARKYNLNVWFRGNFAGWEGWFGYEKISRDEHKKLIEQFILKNGDLFEDGDVFSACPECENGGTGDPRFNSDADGHRKFLVDEYKTTTTAFKLIGKDVKSNFNSMNADVAKLIMDKKTTNALGGLVVIDHYVKTPEKMASDIKDIAQKSGGKVILGEFGAPVPDIHGSMSREQQAEWVEKTLELMAPLPELLGVSYWTNIGGSTEIWSNASDPKPAVASLRKFFIPRIFKGKVINELGEPVAASVTSWAKVAKTNVDGRFEIAYLENDKNVKVIAQGYVETDLEIGDHQIVILKKTEEGLIFRIMKFFKEIGLKLKGLVKR